MERSKTTATLRNAIRRLPSHFSLNKGITSGNRVSLLKNGSRAFPAMLDAIDQARCIINLEIYNIRSDETGWLFANHLAVKTQKGILVNLIYDGFGSLGTDRNFFLFLEKAGVSLLEYHPIFPWRWIRQPHWSWLKRDHRKMLIVDSQVAFTGGLNIGDEYAGTKGWRDTFIQIEGPAVQDLQGLFIRTWKRHGGTPFDSDRYLNGAPLGLPEDAPSSKEESNTVMVQVLGNREFENRHRIRTAFVRAVKKAKKNVYFAHAYFIPDRGVRRALRNAARRGVDVKILLPSVSDVPAITYACHALYTRFLNKGIRIFEWPHEVLHSKTITIDGLWSSIGSYNLDHRSLFHNLEINVNVYGNTFGQQMDEMFLEDLSQSREILLSEWENRPTYQRVLERFFFFLRYWL